MRVIKPSVELVSKLNAEEILLIIEKAGRICYRSENKITDDSAHKFIKNLIKLGHESVIEHCSITVKIICDRGVSHEIVRHRIASYSQESTRYCNYTHDKFENELCFIEPCFWNNDLENESLKEIWLESLRMIEENYFNMIELGAKPEEARSILPNSLKTEMFVTMNLRAWRHFLKLRINKKSHPQIREIANIVLKEFTENLPIFFDDIR